MPADSPRPKNITEQSPMNWLTAGSPLEETLRLLIENLKAINQIVTSQASDNKRAIDEIVEQLSKIPIQDIIKGLETLDAERQLWDDIISRISESKRVDIRAKDVDYVIAELIIEAYSSLIKKKKWAIVIEGVKWLFGILLGAGVIWAIKLMGQIITKMN